MRHLALPLCLCTALMAGCDALGIESAAQVAERKQAEAHAIGSACRHAVRSVEDCFKTNPKAGKAAVFAGWKEMDQYMRDNQIVGMPSPIESSSDDEGTADDSHASDSDAPPSSGTGERAKPAARDGHESKTQRS